MERLTTKVDDIYTCSYCENQEAINKLAEFEDFMEEYEFKSIKKLNSFVYEKINNYKKVALENQALKDRWKKLKEYIINEFNYDKENIRMVGKDYGYGCINTEEDILSKMQELEKEIK